MTSSGRSQLRRLREAANGPAGSKGDALPNRPTANRLPLRGGQRTELLHAVVTLSEVANQYAERLIDVE